MKGIDFNNIMINAGVFASVLVAMLTILIPLIWKLWNKNQSNKFEKLTDKLDSTAKIFTEKTAEMKDDFKHLRSMHEDHYEFQRHQIQKTAELEVSQRNLEKQLDELSREHRSFTINGGHHQ